MVKDKSVYLHVIGLPMEPKFNDYGAVCCASHQTRGILDSPPAVFSSLSHSNFISQLKEIIKEFHVTLMFLTLE